MANSKNRTPFRPLGLRLLQFSRQIIQTYAASDPIAREMLQRSREETPYEPLPWADEGDENPFEPDMNAPDQDFPDQRIEPQRPQQRPPQAPRPAAPQQVSRSKKRSRPGSNLVDVGGVMVPEHVVQAMRNHQEREAIKEKNKQSLVDDMQKSDSDSILVQRRKRGRGMQVDYVSTDSLKGDENPSPPSAGDTVSPKREDESDDTDASSSIPGGSLSPPGDVPVMREADHVASVNPDVDYDDEFDEDIHAAEFDYPVADESSAERNWQQPAPSADAGPTHSPSIQRAPMEAAHEEPEQREDPITSGVDMPQVEPPVSHEPAIQRSFDTFDSTPQDVVGTPPDTADEPVIEPPRRNARRGRQQVQPEQPAPQVHESTGDAAPRHERRVQRDTTPSVSDDEAQDIEADMMPPSDMAVQRRADPIPDYDDDYDPDYEDGGYFDTVIYGDGGQERGGDQPPAPQTNRIQRSAEAPQTDYDAYDADYDPDYDIDYDDGGYFDPTDRGEVGQESGGSQVTPPVQSDAPVQRQTDPDDVGMFEFEDEVPPLSKPIIEDDYYDAALGTERMRAITPEDLASYDARRGRKSPPPAAHADGQVQRKTDHQPEHHEADASDYHEQPMDLHRALFEAGWVREPPQSVSEGVQRQAADDAYDDSYDYADYGDADGGDYYDAGGGDYYHADGVNGSHSTNAIQRSSDQDNAEIAQPGSVPADLLDMMNLPPNTPIVGLDEVFGGSSKRQSSAESSQPAPRPKIQRDTIDAPQPDRQQTFVSQDDEAAELGSDEIDNIAQEVYRRLRDRIRNEWERRNRF